jgi:hypothetical protein
LGDGEMRGMRGMREMGEEMTNDKCQMTNDKSMIDDIVFLVLSNH